MYFLITAIKICHTRIRPTQSSEKIFSMDSLKFVIKESKLSDEEHFCL